MALALALLLLAAKEASAGKYEVAQCGWYVGADASWSDTTGGAKFSHDAWCVPPAGQDAFDGAHVKSLTRSGQATVSGTRYARWRWQAPAGTGITRVSGSWWHALHDGIEQRLGTIVPGGFDVFAATGATDTTPRGFVAGFSTPRPAFEDRLLCARAASKWCSLEPGSWSAVRALTITVEDDQAPSAGDGGDLLSGGWKHGAQSVAFWGADAGGGLRFGETTVDGNRVDLTEHACAKASIGGEWRATRMQPCGLTASGSATVDTTRFSDGPHGVRHCETDFAGNVGCTTEQVVRIDNNPPAHPRNLSPAGGDGWRRVGEFDVGWENPDQGPASPIAGACWRLVGPGGYDTGVRFAAGLGLNALRDLAVPRAGVYTLSVWLRDEAGNEAPASAVSLPLRFDDVPPSVAFEAASGAPGSVAATVADADSGPATGRIYFRRADRDSWRALPTELERRAPDSAELTAQLPKGLARGIYFFRATGTDAAGNEATTTRRADGSEMKVRIGRHGVDRGARRTRIFARLRRRGRSGSKLTVPFGATATLAGRLLDARGRGIAGRRLRVVSRPSRGALAERRTDSVTTGRRGGFALPLAAGPSRRITVVFPGDGRLGGAVRAPLSLRVRSGVELRATPSVLRTGESVRFQGRVRSLGAPLPRRGKLVAIQYFERGAGRWRPVLVARTDHSGRFRTRYRFRYVSGAASIRLRATALPEERWPYAPGSSPPVTVRVNG
ncbi:MAG: hypothetical protein ACM3N0_00510 [Chloroflexota bacterium]